MRAFDARALRRLHIATDLLLVSLAWLGAYWLRFALGGVLGRPLNPFASYALAMPVIVAPWVFSCWLFGIYKNARMRTLVDHLQDLFRGVLLGLLVISAISFFFKEFEFGRLVVAFTGAISLLLQGTSRVVFYRLERDLQRSGRADVPALIIGTGVSAIRLLQKLQDHPEIGYRVVGFLDEAEDAAGKDVAGHPVLGALDDLREVVHKHEVGEVFVALPSLSHTRMLSLVLECEDLGLTFRIVTDLFEVLTAGTPVDLIDDLPLVRLGRTAVHPLYVPAKRAFDLVAASLGLLLALPLLLWTALRIRLDSPGPAIFRHQRVGKDGALFTFYKFRTMRSQTEPYAHAPNDGDDARMSDYGRWLRRTSIDELPQLINVIKGEMSLVGPRPEMPFIVADYDVWQRRRLTVKPGLTGLWQILGRKDLPMHENLQYDFYYIRNRSLLLDLSILLRTVGVVLSRRGAY